MAQPPGGAPEGTPVEGFRQRHHRERRREFLRTALSIVTTDGLAALTMQRVTEALGASVGSIYHYFPSKSALIAELQREALTVLGQSVSESQLHLDALVASRGVPSEVGALAKPLAAARFWVAAEDSFPLEIQLLRLEFAAPGLLFALDEGRPVYDVAVALVGLGQGLLDQAVAHGALRQGANLDRALLLVAGTTGVLMTAELGRVDERLVAGQRLARQMIRDLLVAWGAQPDVLASADLIVDELEALGHLTPSPSLVHDLSYTQDQSYPQYESSTGLTRAGGGGERTW